MHPRFSVSISSFTSHVHIHARTTYATVITRYNRDFDVNPRRNRSPRSLPNANDPTHRNLGVTVPRRFSSKLCAIASVARLFSRSGVILNMYTLGNIVYSGCQCVINLLKFEKEYTTIDTLARSIQL